MTANRLDSRAWLLWGAAAVIPLLVARNPFLVFVVLVSVLAVRTVWASRARQGWQWIVRVAVLFMVIGVIFNALTVHAGDQVLFTIPDVIPLIGGRITLNAIAYGIVSGLAVVTLVLTGTTVAAGLVWADLMRSMPPRVAPIAVAGSVAWSFLPSASQAFQEIRESQAARGLRIRGLRDLPPLVVPLLGGGLERAITMSEALESRGFGHSGAATVSSPASRWLLVGTIGIGVPLESDQPELVEAILHIRDTARKNGVAPGVHTSGAEGLNARIEQGFQFCALASEMKYMMGGLSEAIGQLNWQASDRSQRVDSVTAEEGTVVRY